MTKKVMLTVLAVSLGASSVQVAAILRWDPYLRIERKYLPRFSKLVHIPALGAWLASNVLLLKNAYSDLKETFNSQKTKKERAIAAAKLAGKTAGCCTLNFLAFKALYKLKTILRVLFRPRRTH